MTVIVIVACVSIAGAELFLARGARRVSDRLARLEDVTLRQEQHITALTARMTGPAGPVSPRGTAVSRPVPSVSSVSSMPAGPAGPAGPVRPLATDEAAGLRERMSALEEARRADRDLCARLDGAVESLERVMADVFRLTVGELDRAAARTLDGIPVVRAGDPGGAGRADGGPIRRARRALAARRRPGRRGRRAAVAVALATATGVLVGAATLPAGSALSATSSGVARFLTVYGGVLALVALTSSVGTGLVATGRGMLKIRHRILLQVVHRAATLTAVALLAVHVTTTVLAGHARVAQIILPNGSAAPIALGTIAAEITALVAVTGLVRRRFAGGRRPGLWRAAHRLAYAGWFLAVMHGLFGGRRPAAWVTWSYVLCLAGVAVALLTRGALVMRSRGAPARSTRPGPDRPAGARPGVTPVRARR